jgi:hypothetical protein
MIGQARKDRGVRGVQIAIGSGRPGMTGRLRRSAMYQMEAEGVTNLWSNMQSTTQRSLSQRRSRQL